ncbi:hypothetical protein AK812_SmicGene30219 [Symbiodinium microadriaticum]|uniref:Uncharacterized protein n=1 Tax=Symbiodinium microadriaticum TaxID=2951 RepID=A0A1Q9CZV7_SYMMI|nr:hypothetical protein AK812_SmicGene30219 [Symbiodinium microadriaticum]
MEQRAETEKPPEAEVELPRSPVSPAGAEAPAIRKPSHVRRARREMSAESTLCVAKEPATAAAAAPALEEAVEVSMPSASVLPAAGSTASTAATAPAPAAPLPQLSPASPDKPEGHIHPKLKPHQCKCAVALICPEAKFMGRGLVALPGGDTTELDEEEETPPEKRGEPAPAPAAAESRNEEPELASSKLATAWALTEGLRVKNSARLRCLVLSNFAVRRPGPQVEDLLVVRCQVYPADVIGSNVQGAKRARKVLNCGHWIFRIEFRFKLALQEDDSPFFEVFVAGEAVLPRLSNGCLATVYLLPTPPCAVLSDPDARVEPQKLLDALRQELSIEMQMYTVGGRHWWGCSQDFRKSQADAGIDLRTPTPGPEAHLGWTFDCSFWGAAWLAERIREVTNVRRCTKSLADLVEVMSVELFGSSLPRCSPGGLRNSTLLRMWWYGPSPYHGYGHDWWGPPRYYRDRYDRDRKWDREQDKDKEGKPADRPRSEDGEKGKEANSGPALELARKPYRQIIDELIKNTVLCRNDFDHKILLLLDALWERNRLQDACSHVKKVVEVLPRDKVTHWRGYLHKLLRNFDEDAYHDVKGTLAAANAEKLPWIQEKPPASGDSLRVCAAEFQPGQLAWTGAIGKNEYVAVATHRLCADAPEFDPSQSTWAPRAVEKAEGA